LRRRQLQDVAIVLDFVFVILCVAGLLGLLAKAALQEDDDRQAVRVRHREPHLTE
jgi:hypothetical protein